MLDPIIAGSILMDKGIHLPNPLLFQKESGSSGWVAVKDPSPAFEKTIRESGWTFFFMAGEIKATVFGFDKQRALRTALQRLLTEVQSQHCNSIEIARVTGKSFLNVPYVTVFAHARHLQKGPLFSTNGNSI